MVVATIGDISSLGKLNLLVTRGYYILAQELLFGWPTQPWALQQLAARASVVLPALGLDTFPLDTPLASLSDGYKRRAALAVALVRRPSVLLLDEPLAGLDWRARADIASVLGARPMEP